MNLMRSTVVALVGVVAVVSAGCEGTKKHNPSSGHSSATATLKDVPGFSLANNEIHLGVITSLTGPVAEIGKSLTGGTETWFKYYNAEKGGIGGKYKVVLDEKDSADIPQNAVKAYTEIKGNVVMLTQLLGTTVTKAVLPLLRADGLTAVPASLDAGWVREPNLLPIGSPYQVQMINAASYLVNDKGMKNKVFCSMIQNDAYGQAGQAGIDFAAKQLGFSVKATALYPPGNSVFTPQITQLKSGGCEVVFIVSTPSDTGKAFGTAAQLQFTPQWVGQSPSYIGTLAKSSLAPYLQAHFLLASEGTEWGDPNVKGMKDMIDRLTKYDPQQHPDPSFSLGYIEAWATTQVLERAVQMGDLSRAGITKAMEQVGTLKFDGLSGDYKYGPASKRNPPRETTIFKIDPAKPIGIAIEKASFESDAAKKFTF